MKILSVIIGLVFMPLLTLHAQPARDTSAAYLKTKTLPNLQLLLTDSSTIYTKDSLPKNKTIAIIFFSPDCEHCQAEATELMTKTDSLKNIYMVWNANMVADFTQVKEFYYKYGFNKLSNVVMGKEINYYLPVFYMIENTPYCAVYKNGNLFTEFRNSLHISDLIAIAHDKYTPVIYQPIKHKTKKRKTKS